eukprot:597811-Prymnesium_polylepis.1
MIGVGESSSSRFGLAEPAARPRGRAARGQLKYDETSEFFQQGLDRAHQSPRLHLWFCELREGPTPTSARAVIAVGAEYA